MMQQHTPAKLDLSDLRRVVTMPLTSCVKYHKHSELAVSYLESNRIVPDHIPEPHKGSDIGP